MEIMHGKSTCTMSAADHARIMEGYSEILIDLGTGDGRFALHAARLEPAAFAIGVDACCENLREAARSLPANALFAIANVAEPGCALFDELRGLASRVTINFPWGSLRDALLNSDPFLLDGLWALMRPGAGLEIRLNASALAEAGWDLAGGGRRAAESLSSGGLPVLSSKLLTAPDLRALPSTWAKRLASGRDPQAIWIRARKEREAKNNTAPLGKWQAPVRFADPGYDWR